MFDISKHSKTKKLISQIKEYSNLNDFTYIQVSGVPIEYKKEILSLLPKGILFHTNNLNQAVKNVTSSLKFFDINEITYSELIKELSNCNYEKVDRISKQGEYSVKGDLIKFWPSLYEYPIRLDFFGDEIETAEIYDLSINLKILDIKNVVLVSESMIEADPIPFKIINPSANELNRVILCFDQYASDLDINFDFRQPPLFFQRFDLLEDYINLKVKEGTDVFINTRHKDKLPTKLKKYVNLSKLLPSGIVSQDLNEVIFTDREIFGTIFLTDEVAENISSSESRKILSQFEGEVQIGDYVVHEDHGIGQYIGLVQEKASAEHKHKTNYIKIKYAKNGELLVPLNLVYKITKYIGTDNEKPKLTTLGKKNWERMTARARAAVELMASELVRHYAKIELSESQPVKIEDSEDYKEFVSNFEYDETPDQLRSIQEIKRDLSLEKPMNRLLVGDVGFGKTEVIMRAAFKVVEAGQQVAILCPTTLLTSQHYKSFSKRFKDFGYKIGFLSRFNNKYENKDIIEKVKSGEIDIIIGTHRLISNDIGFDNLGLLVIDEEQKFGVKQKEKIKKYQFGVNVLSTTATPIPRTLSMALSTVQSISTIQTPPKGRKAVKTKVGKMDWNEIVEAIELEKKRGGQVFIIYNSVKTINSISAQLQRLMPDLKLVVAHGQMSGQKIEKIMLDFLNKKYDCLISTTIVENGIDIANVNTLIVLKSQRFGLSQLYQLRGRVGRSEKQAYAYFFYDGKDLDKIDQERSTEDKNTKKQNNKAYVKRLKALAQASELGAGFEIATKDLEMRGAGNMLGSKQHGHISKVGFGLYMQMLAQEIERLKNEKKN